MDVEPNQPGQSYTRRATVGVLSVVAASLVSRAGGFIAQLFLGWMLAKPAFTLWAMTSVASIFIAGLRDGGAGRIIMQNGRDAADRVRSIADFCWILNGVAAATLLLIAPITAAYFGNRLVIELIWLMAIAVAISAPLTIGRARMAVELRFREVAMANAILSILNYTVMVVLAWKGFGAKSFVIPQIVTNIVGAIVFARLLNASPSGPRITWQRFWQIATDAKWLILSAFAISLAMTGDYLIIGRFAKPYLADYSFGFQLTLAISVLFGPAIQEVLMPTFTRLNNEPNRQAAAYARAARLTTFAVAPVCVAMAFLAPPLVKIAWQGKWDAAIPVIQIMSINIMFRMLTPLAYSLLQSRGKWSLAAIPMIIEGVVVLLASFIGTQFGSLLAIALCVGIFRTILPPSITYLAAKDLGLSSTELFRSIAKRMIPFLLLTGTLLVIAHNINVSSVWQDLAVRVVLLSTGLATVILFAFKEDMAEILQLIRNRSATA